MGEPGVEGCGRVGSWKGGAMCCSVEEMGGGRVRGKGGEELAGLGEASEEAMGAVHGWFGQTHATEGRWQRGVPSPAHAPPPHGEGGGCR
ncbi:hypothetical protein CLOP_g14205 [Closterium sp. NIES-67]|nr:hypothetical protein CLOP_g14205 [Closterium sp. NIES-67]